MNSRTDLLILVVFEMNGQHHAQWNRNFAPSLPTEVRREDIAFTLTEWSKDRVEGPLYDALKESAREKARSMGIEKVTHLDI